MLVDVASLTKQMTGLDRVYVSHMELAEPSIAQGFAQAVRDGAAPGREPGRGMP